MNTSEYYSLLRSLGIQQKKAIALMDYMHNVGLLINADFIDTSMKGEVAPVNVKPEKRSK